MTVEGPQISGKVFRFLSAMHPALSKGERKRYEGYDPEKWYACTPEISAEFTDLMPELAKKAGSCPGLMTTGELQRLRRRG